MLRFFNGKPVIRIVKKKLDFGGDAVKQKEDDRDVIARCVSYRDKLIALLKEWPYKQRVADQTEYTDALRAWHEECQGKEKP